MPRQVWLLRGARWAKAALLTIVALAYFAFRPAPVRQAHFRQVTFRRGQVLGARFAPDGHSVLYTAQWDREWRQLYFISGVAPESRPLGFQDMSLQSVSRSGELALLQAGGTMNIGGGKLMRVPMNGGSPLLVDQSIWTAEWSPDGRTMALVRAVSGSSQIEFPAGKVLYRTSGWLSHLRFSPAGDEIAFMEHPLRHDDSGSLKGADGGGRRQGRGVRRVEQHRRTCLAPVRQGNLVYSGSRGRTSIGVGAHAIGQAASGGAGAWRADAARYRAGRARTGLPRD